MSLCDDRLYIIKIHINILNLIERIIFIEDYFQEKKLNE